MNRWIIVVSCLLTACVAGADLGCASSVEKVTICREYGDSVVCKRRYVPKGSYDNGYSRPLNLPPTPRSSKLRVPYDDGSGPQPTDPATLVGERVGLHLVSGKELWARIADVTDEEIVFNYRGSEWSYSPEEIALLRRLRD